MIVTGKGLKHFAQRFFLILEVPVLMSGCDVLNIRSGAGTGYSVVGAIREVTGKKNKYTIVEEKNGWGRLKSGAGWISLSYTKKAS